MSKTTDTYINVYQNTDGCDVASAALTPPVNEQRRLP